MKLTELFVGNKQIADAGKSQVNTTRTDVVNRQIQSMVPGQTIQGEIVSKSGSEVQIRVSADVTLQAKLDQNMNLEIGKNMTFEVKNNGKALVLSPLFTNVATDANVLKALDMASLPVNDTTISLTQQLMEAGLSIDRGTLQQVYREVNLFPQAQTSDIVNLHKLQMPVNESNVAQMASYRNLTHQLVTGMNNVLEAVPDMLSQMMESGNTEGAVKLYQQLVLMAQEASAEGSVLPDSQITDGKTLQILPDGTVLQGTLPEGMAAEGVAENVLNESPANALGAATAQGDGAQAVVIREGMAQGIPTADAVAKGMQQTTEALLDIPIGAQNGEEIAANGTVGENAIENLQGNGQNQASLYVGQENNNSSGNSQSLQLQNLLGQLPTDLSTQNILLQLTQMIQDGSGGKDFLNPLLQLLKQQWTIAPEQVADGEQVESLYRRLDKQLKNLSQVMESAGQTDTAAYKAVTNMNQNLDFLQQVNQLYTYVQLPLRLQNGEAHGDLYVYTNKKHLAAKDGQISALLHLDMEHLGPVDVYVSMINEKVNTRFYLQDDEMLDFITDHMDILTERLQKRGYQCSFEMQVRGEQGEEETAKTGIQRLLEQENHVPLAEYAFDVRT